MLLDFCTATRWANRTLEFLENNRTACWIWNFIACVQLCPMDARGKRFDSSSNSTPTIDTDGKFLSFFHRSAHRRGTSR